MIRVLFLIMISILSIFAQTFHFKEQRYIYAIDNSTFKKGHIYFKEDVIIVTYENTQKAFHYYDDKLFIKEKEHTTQVDLEQQLATKIFFLILEAIFQDKPDNLELFFTIEQNAQETLLRPKEVLSNYISSITYKKEETLKFLNIQLLNNDRIIIEQID